MDIYCMHIQVDNNKQSFDNWHIHIFSFDILLGLLLKNIFVTEKLLLSGSVHSPQVNSFTSGWMKIIVPQL